MMPDPKLVVFDDMAGRPFMGLGLPDHSVCGETFEGQKIRAGGVETVWNDMLLMDAVEGEGFYLQRAWKYERACLEVAERMYGMSAADGLKHWLGLPKIKKGVN